ncbi:MAG: N-acetylglucosamine-6-phosphate deacetylase [Verrucomicrobiota bacterium]|nr:N-acetylglucosamine-6-phosphate deacetylase [Verrucomicrobiota bacterium]
MKDEWVDLQINGYGGVDFNAPGLTVEQVISVTDRLECDGTRGYLPTIVTGNPETTVETLRVIAAARKRSARCERNILGVHLEGPFISSELGAVGTHPIEWVAKPSRELFDRFQDAGNGLVRLVTVAAEVPGMPEFVKWLSSQGVVVSLGHQMASTPDDVRPCIEAGAKAFTHLGNGIPNMIPRHDNIIFTALAEDRVSVMFIPDGHHLPDAMLKVYTRAVPLKRLIAVSDAQYPAGMPPGEYDVCGAHARLEPNGLLWNPSRNCLVGATTPMAAMMKLLQDRIGLSMDECIAIGRDNPRALIGA